MTSPDYKLLNSQLLALVDDETDALANTSNFVGLLFNNLETINWLGIYVLRGDELVLGPFQGKTACVRIALGNGVCGTAAATLSTQRVADVHEFPGHIVCEIVEKKLIGVLDIDSPALDRFSAADQEGIEMLCRTFCELLAARGSSI
jgi:GAF domain-containing protein